MSKDVWNEMDKVVEPGLLPSQQEINVSTVLTNKIPYSIHNNIALILCINHLDMPFNVHTIDKMTMITVSGFLTI